MEVTRILHLSKFHEQENFALESVGHYQGQFLCGTGHNAVAVIAGKRVRMARPQGTKIINHGFLKYNLEQTLNYHPPGFKTSFPIIPPSALNALIQKVCLRFGRIESLI